MPLLSPIITLIIYRYARYIRGRYTVLDLAYDLGLFEDLREEVLVHSEANS